MPTPLHIAFVCFSLLPWFASRSDDPVVVPPLLFSIKARNISRSKKQLRPLGRLLLYGV